MTKQLRFLAVGLLMAASQAATASNSLSDFPLRTLPVLVSVDASGKVTDASPAMQLPPAIKRLLLTNLDEMISGPAHSKDKPISSQCIINVALKATRRDDGNYDAGFTYLSTQPVPIGRWHWVNLDGRRLMLASDDYPGACIRIGWMPIRVANSAACLPTRQRRCLRRPRTLPPHRARLPPGGVEPGAMP